MNGGFYEMTHILLKLSKLNTKGSNHSPGLLIPPWPESSGKTIERCVFVQIKVLLTCTYVHVNSANRVP